MTCAHWKPSASPDRDPDCRLTVLRASEARALELAGNLPGRQVSMPRASRHPPPISSKPRVLAQSLPAPSHSPAQSSPKCHTSAAPQLCSCLPRVPAARSVFPGSCVLTWLPPNHGAQTPAPTPGLTRKWYWRLESTAGQRIHRTSLK